MIEKFYFIEPLKGNSLFSESPGLKIKDNSPNVLLLSRIVAGTIDIYDNFKEKKFKYRIDFTELPSKKKRLSINNLISNFPDEVSPKDISDYFLKYGKKNDDYFKSINWEVCNCINSKIEKKYLESFIFLYRCLEAISYGFPLIYASKTKTFKRTYRSLESFFLKRDSTGELAFLNRFLNEIYSKEDFFKTTIDIDFSSIYDSEIRLKYFQKYIELLKDNDIQNYTEPDFVQIKFGSFHKLIINIRNRYFHFTQGGWQNNLSSLQIISPDEFFQPIIIPGINWLSKIIIENIKFGFSNSF